MPFGLSWLQTTAIGLCLFIGIGAASFAIGYERGQFQAQLAAQKAQTAAVIKATEDARAMGIAEGTITINAERHAAEAKEKIVYRTITQIKEIPIYVTPKADASCTIPAGFLRVLDDAASGSDSAKSVPNAAGEPPDAATDVKLSEVAASVVANYGAYNQIREQLIALQDWVRQQQALHH